MWLVRRFALPTLIFLLFCRSSAFADEAAPAEFGAAVQLRLGSASRSGMARTSGSFGS